MLIRLEVAMKRERELSEIGLLALTAARRLAADDGGWVARHSLLLGNLRRLGSHRNLGHDFFLDACRKDWDNGGSTLRLWLQMRLWLQRYRNS